MRRQPTRVDSSSMWHKDFDAHCEALSRWSARISLEREQAGIVSIAVFLATTEMGIVGSSSVAGKCVRLCIENEPSTTAPVCRRLPIRRPPAHFQYKKEKGYIFY